MTTTIPTTPAKRFSVIDGLRGVAILWVTLFHFARPVHDNNAIWNPINIGPIDLVPFLRSGSQGVSLFFALSGFCLFYPMIKNGFKFDFKNFWMRRVIRIYPAYIVNFAVFFVIYYLSGKTDAGFQLLTHLTFTSSFFRSTFGAVNSVLWSLNVEDWFYITLPILGYCFYRWPKYSLIGSVTVASISTAYVFCVHGFDPFLIRMLPCRLLDFVAGMYAASIYARGIQLGNKAVAACWIVGLSGIFIAPYANLLFYPVNGDIQHSLVSAVSAMSWFALITAAIYSPKSIGSRILSAQPLVGLGIVSFSLYLYQPLRLIVPKALGIEYHSALWWIVAILANGIACIISYYVTEKPFLLLRDKLRAKTISQESPKTHHAPKHHRLSRTPRSVTIERPQEV